MWWLFISAKQVILKLPVSVGQEFRQNAAGMLVSAPSFLGPQLEDSKPERLICEGPFVHVSGSGCWLLAVDLAEVLGWNIHMWPDSYNETARFQEQAS